MQEFFQLLQYLLATNSIYIIAGDFNYDSLKVSKNKRLDIFTDHVQKKISQHISESLIDHAGLYLGQINWKKWMSTQN